MRVWGQLGWGRGRGVRPEPPRVCARVRIDCRGNVGVRSNNPAPLESGCLEGAESLAEHGEPWVEWASLWGR